MLKTHSDGLQNGKIYFEEGFSNEIITELAAMGHAVIKTILELQLKFNKPIGLGIIGPGAEPQHIPSRLEPHARAAIIAVLEGAK